MAASVGVVGLGDDAGGAGRIGLGHRLEAELAQGVAALAQRLRMRQRLLHGQQRRARQRHQLVAHAQEVLADDEQAGTRQQVVDVGHAARHRVLDGDHGVARLAALHGGQRILEGGAGDRLEVGIHLAAGQVRVGAGLALVGDAQPASSLSEHRRALILAAGLRRKPRAISAFRSAMGMRVGEARRVR